MIPDYQIHLYMIRIYNESQSLTHPYQNLYQHFHSHIHDSLFWNIQGNHTWQPDKNDQTIPGLIPIFHEFKASFPFVFEVEKPNPPSANNRTTLLLKKK